jgi:integrase/recombinase XerD
LSGVTKKHKKEVERAVRSYSKYILFTVDKQKSLEYFKNLKNRFSIKYYKKQMQAIKKFLLHLGISWVNELVLPKDPTYLPRRLTQYDIDTMKNRFPTAKAIISLGCSSGLRAEELYSLTLNDLDLDTRTVYVRHSKTGVPRISFFDEKTRDLLRDFKGFSQNHYTRLFRTSEVKTKHLRKFFSQEWDRRGGPTGIKKLLMGHSLRGDVDLCHYNAQSPEDLKMIYDKVMDKGDE